MTNTGKIVLGILVVVGLAIFSAVKDMNKAKKRQATSSKRMKDYIEDDLAYKIKWPTPIDESRGEKISDRLDRKNYYIIFDGSGSMAEKKCSGVYSKETVAKKALKKFVQSIGPDENIGLFIFDRFGAKQWVPLGKNNKKLILQGIDMSQAMGSTPLRTSIAKGVTELAKQAGKQLEYGEYHLVIITDGEASGQREQPGDVVAAALKQTPIVIHSIGFCISENHSLNQPGKTLYKSANNAEELAKGLESVLAESEEFVVTDFK